MEYTEIAKAINCLQDPFGQRTDYYGFPIGTNPYGENFKTVFKIWTLKDVKRERPTIVFAQKDSDPYEDAAFEAAKKYIDKIYAGKKIYFAHGCNCVEKDDGSGDTVCYLRKSRVKFRELTGSEYRQKQCKPVLLL
jgi:hypothetical protein